MSVCLFTGLESVATIASQCWHCINDVWYGRFSPQAIQLLAKQCRPMLNWKIWFVRGHIMSLFVDNQDSHISETYAGLYWVLFQYLALCFSTDVKWMTTRERQQNTQSNKKEFPINKEKNMEQLCVHMCVCFLDVSSWEHGLSSFSVMNLLGIPLLCAGIPTLLSMLSNNSRYVNVFNK